MPRIEALIDYYIDANLILLMAYLIWTAFQMLLARGHLAKDPALRLRFAEGLILAAVASPLIAVALVQVLTSASPKLSLNAADLVLAQFLDGRVAMSAEHFSSILTARDRLIEAIAAPSGWLAVLVVSGFAFGFLTSLNGLARALLRLRNLLRTSHLLRRTARVDILVSDTVLVPFSARGIWRRHVVLPTAMLAEPHELQVALAHEFQHIRRGDTEWELALSLLRPLFFWNPAFHRWKRDLDRLRELHCDRTVLARGRIAARDYADCLLAVCSRRLETAERRVAIGVVPFIDVIPGRKGRRNATALRQRIAAIAEPQARFSASRALLPFLVAAAMAVTLVAATLQRSGDWSQDRLMLSAIVNLERLESHNRGLGNPGF